MEPPPGGAWGRFTLLPRPASMERSAEAPVGGRPLEAVEVLVGVRAEVEVELRDPLLDDAPHRLAEVGHEPHQDERVVVFRAVGGEEVALGGFVELVVYGEVPEV